MGIIADNYERMLDRLGSYPFSPTWEPDVREIMDWYRELQRDTQPPAAYRSVTPNRVANRSQPDPQQPHAASLLYKIAALRERYDLACKCLEHANSTVLRDQFSDLARGVAPVLPNLIALLELEPPHDPHLFLAGVRLHFLQRVMRLAVARINQCLLEDPTERGHLVADLAMLNRKYYGVLSMAPNLRDSVLPKAPDETNAVIWYLRFVEGTTGQTAPCPHCSQSVPSELVYCPACFEPWSKE